MDPSQSDYTTSETPGLLKGLLLALGFGGILSGLFFHKATLLFGLSYEGIAHGRLWQLFTYPLILGSALTWWSLVTLALEVLFLWIYSIPLIEHRGTKSFIFLTIGATLLSGIAATSLQSPEILIGAAPLLFAVLIAWLDTHPGSSLWILGFSLKAGWLILGFIGLDLLIHLSHGDWTAFFANGTGALFGAFYAKIPLFSKRRSKSLKEAKIYDIRSGKPMLDDHQFMDAMLTRISSHGEDSLSSEEKERMKRISERSRHNER